MLAYPILESPFVLETDASICELGAVLSQAGEDGLSHLVAYASHSLTDAERNYSVTELKTLAVMWAMSHFRTYLYGQKVTVFTDHSDAKSILNSPHPTGKHARWWTKVYGLGVQTLEILHRLGKINCNTDALSQSLSPPVPLGVGESELQVLTVSSNEMVVLTFSPEEEEEVDDASSKVGVAAIGSIPSNSMDISALITAEPKEAALVSFGSEQKKDPKFLSILQFIEKGTLPTDGQLAKKVALQAPLFVIA